MTATTLHLRRRASWLVWATIAWNTVEAVVAIVAGALAGSIALIGFGLDSTIEVFAASVAVWFLRDHETREQRALRLIAVSYFVLTSYVVVEAARDLLSDSEASRSTAGLAIAALSVIVMPLLARAKRHTGRELGSDALVAEANQTRLCAYLSIILLVGLGLNATIGWWWADPVAAIGIAVLAAREGRQAWRGDLCCAPAHQDDCCDDD